MTSSQWSLSWQIYKHICLAIDQSIKVGCTVGQLKSAGGVVGTVELSKSYVAS